MQDFSGEVRFRSGLLTSEIHIIAAGGHQAKICGFAECLRGEAGSYLGMAQYDGVHYEARRFAATDWTYTVTNENLVENEATYFSHLGAGAQ